MTDADGRYYADTTTLNNIVQPDGDLSMSNYKITSLADALSDTDALNRQTADGRYYSNSTTLDNITTAAADVSLNSHKLTDLQYGTAHSDAMALGQSMSYQWSNASLSADITSISSPHKIVFDSVQEPSLSGVTPTVLYDTDAVVLSQSGTKYLVDIQIELLYNYTNVPATCQIRALDETTIIKQFVTSRALDDTNKIITRFQYVQAVGGSDVYLKVFLTNTANLASIGSNTTIHVQRLL